ncbi:MAG: class I SAM-dependent methyltransferase, partial [Chloroflexota bacterium]
LLDVGAGTGRFALPLANSVKEVTALDHAAPMLEILMQKMVDQNISNIRLQETAWEDAEVVQHDVVLAAWSLYRLPDITAGMQKLIEATKRTLIVVASPGRPPADTPLHIYFYGALWQAGVYPEIKIVWERLANAEQPRPVALIIWHNEE